MEYCPPSAIRRIEQRSAPASASGRPVDRIPLVLPEAPASRSWMPGPVLAGLRYPLAQKCIASGGQPGFNGIGCDYSNTAGPGNQAQVNSAPLSPALRPRSGTVPVPGTSAQANSAPLMLQVMPLAATRSRRTWATNRREKSDAKRWHLLVAPNPTCEEISSINRVSARGDGGLANRYAGNVSTFDPAGEGLDRSGAANGRLCRRGTNRLASVW
jgi:hypothetical protein